VITVTVNTSDLARALDAARARALDLSPAMRVIAQRLRADTLRNFREGGWYPGKWPASGRVLTARTKANAKSKPYAAGRGPRTLMVTGTLRNSIHAGMASGADFARIGTDVKYAAVHQFGATITPRNAKALRFRLPGGGWATSSRVVIPPRPFLPVNAAGDLHPDTAEFCRRTIERHIARGTRGERA
jgi:phage gpG-like protein